MDARITEMNVALDNLQAAYEAMEAEYNANLQDGDVVGPNLALAVARLCHTSRQLQELGEKIDIFIAMREVLLISNDITLIGENDSAASVPVGLVDGPEEHEPEEHELEEPNPAATEGTTENDTTTPESEREDNTSESVVSVEDNWHQNALNPHNH